MAARIPQTVAKGQIRGLLRFAIQTAPHDIVVLNRINLRLKFPLDILRYQNLQFCILFPVNLLNAFRTNGGLGKPAYQMPHDLIVAALFSAGIRSRTLVS
jgi:hypothetical protein